MAELEKVINGLTCCINHNNCKKCPYANEYDTTFDCIDRTRKDALELLKKQLKTKVVFMRNSDGSFQTECGNCGTYLDKAYSRCPKCQKELDWNSNQT